MKFWFGFARTSVRSTSFSGSLEIRANQADVRVKQESLDTTVDKVSLYAALGVNGAFCALNSGLFMYKSLSTLV